ncbi:MAG: hypothetical protein ACTH31_09765 [Pseudoclavibacter sp.]
MSDADHGESPADQLDGGATVGDDPADDAGGADASGANASSADLADRGDAPAVPEGRIRDRLGDIEAAPLAERAAAYGELHDQLGRALDEDD